MRKGKNREKKERERKRVPPSGESFGGRGEFAPFEDKDEIHPVESDGG
jgi:hypothetical protein